MKSLKSLYVTDGIIEWKLWTGQINLCEQFPLDIWHNIIFDIDTENDWQQFLKNYSRYVTCFVLYKVSTGQPIAFCYLMQEDERGDVVSYHGGGWIKSISATMMYYRGTIRMIEALLANRIRVRSASLLKNDVAKRFLQSIGFVRYTTTPTRHLYWINEKWLKSTKIYKYLVANTPDVGAI